MEEIQWEDAMDKFRNALMDIKNTRKDLIGLVGEFNSCETLTAFKDFMNRLNCDDFASHSFHFSNRAREDYLLNRTVPEVESLDCLVLVGCDPKLESPVFNARILKAVKHNGLKVFKIGAPDNLNYEYIHLGQSTEVLSDLLK